MESGKHSYSGKCAPGNTAWTYETFSIGVFQWIQRKNGKGLKKGPIKVRVRGLCREQDKVYAMAAEIAFQLDAGTYTGKKNVSIRDAKDCVDSLRTE